MQLLCKKTKEMDREMNINKDRILWVTLKNLLRNRNQEKIYR